ncbi:MAG TPA: 3-dehydroquinate synthase family protein [Candidatus Binatia bacterium]|nr:3-dehydroquinate synthase family protein [Candidatus Binatia bacterium]
MTRPSIQISASRGRIRYPVRIAPGLLDRAGALLRADRAPGSVLVVTDRTVARLHGARVLASLRRAGWAPHVVALPPGERSKTLARVRALCERWAAWGVDRSVPVLALGGGVVSDVAGFAAAAYARGLDWYAFPTTVLAQADASIGGKVGVNLPGGKNLVGAFHHPRGVFSDPDALRTLPPRALRSGLAEVAKIGVIRRPAILDGLRRLAGEGGARWALEGPGRARLAGLIRAAALEKAWYVSRDPDDRGIRRELNFGHTVGHALEVSQGYGRLTHGEAVSIGMVAALRLSVRAAGLDPAASREVEDLLRSLGLPVGLKHRPGKMFWRALARDKKRGRLRTRMVLSPAIGAAKTYELPSLTPLRGVVLSLVQKP